MSEAENKARIDEDEGSALQPHWRLASQMRTASNTAAAWFSKCMALRKDHHNNNSKCCDNSSNSSSSSNSKFAMSLKFVVLKVYKLSTRRLFVTTPRYTNKQQTNWNKKKIALSPNPKVLSEVPCCAALYVTREGVAVKLIMFAFYLNGLQRICNQVFVQV